MKSSSYSPAFKVTRILFVCCLLFLHITAEAQKIKPHSIDGSCIHYPIIALPSSYTTYAVSVASKGNTLSEFSQIANPEEKIQLTNFKKIASAADLNIKIIIDQVGLYDPLTNKSIPSLDMLKGRNSESLIGYTFGLGFEITDNKGIVIQREAYTGVNTFDSNTLLVTKQATCKTVDIMKSVTSTINMGVEDINTRIRDLCDTYREKYPLYFYTIKASKTETFEEFKLAVQNLEKAFKNPSDENALQTALQSSIAFWEEKLNTFNSANEDEKSHYFLCASNLAAAYCYLDNFDKSVEYLEKAQAADSKPAYTYLLKGQILKRKKIKEQYLADKAKNPEDIYQRNTVQNSSPGNIFDLVKKQPPKTEPDFMEQGLIVLLSGDTLFGKFIEFDTNLKNGKILFVENGKPKKDFIKPFANILILSIRGQVYCPDPDKKDNLWKVIYSSPTLVALSNRVEAVFIFLSRNEHTHYQLYDPADGASYVTNYKKKLSEAFKDTCPFVEEKALRGEYELKQEGVKSVEQVIRDFESQCGSKEYEKNLKMLDEKRIQSLYK